ncbi:hypothetical protein RXV91_13650 [Lactiplantibacillus sp. DA1]|uniref:hypothetical protein n=1 Tax=Lactiplantibacillus sp. DA1 TaxID=3079857 RepID=UPI00292A645A|nr:hypothetical protein [Lactiplantibacillus sp. DA1]MDV0431914.1 hypothetical protein [Lactiplantibacillus sp. DA1]
MTDVTFNSTFAATLQYELHQPVLSLPLSLQIGDLTRLTTDGPAQLANSADDPVVKQALATLKSQVKQGAVLRVWWSMPDDWVGFDWLCQQLVDTDAQLRQVMVPLSYQKYCQKILRITYSWYKSFLRTNSVLIVMNGKRLWQKMRRYGSILTGT